MVDVPVLVVGGGPVGMSLGLLLDRFGVGSLVIDRRWSTSGHPKAHGCSIRTMEHFRQWGIEDAIRAEALPDGIGGLIITVGSAVGPIVGMTREDHATNSPTSLCMVTQDVVERALAGALAAASTARHRRGVELMSFAEDADGVTAELRDLADSTVTHVRSQYIVGCDGPTSLVRQIAGIAMEGPDNLARSANYCYRADLRDVPRARFAPIIQVVPSQPGSPSGTLVFGGNAGTRWQYFAPPVPGAAEDVPLLDDASFVELIRTLWNDPALDVTLESVMRWTLRAQVAATFRQGRALVVGDAAHTIPPAGGLGMNSGIQGAHNLAWKLAYVVRGVADEALLDTYDAERRPVTAANVAWAMGNAQRMFGMADALRNREADPAGWRKMLLDLDHHVNSEGQGMGFIYERGALIDDGSPVPDPDARYYWPTDRPGARFPHQWLDSAGKESTLDWFDTTFVLVCGPQATPWRSAGETIASSGRPLTVHTLPDDMGYATIARDGALLVRPDGHVAWRSRSVGLHPETELTRALDDILTGRSLAAQ
jgi:2-polyprenyl-6-methoxyphenol hydroxylase-like FAD-dependent oxidoreductase